MPTGATTSPTNAVKRPLLQRAASSGRNNSHLRVLRLRLRLVGCVCHFTSVQTLETRNPSLKSKLKLEFHFRARKPFFVNVRMHNTSVGINAWSCRTAQNTGQVDAFTAAFKPKLRKRPGTASCFTPNAGSSTNG
jgi:hypothetical protein